MATFTFTVKPAGGGDYANLSELDADLQLLGPDPGNLNIQDGDTVSVTAFGGAISTGNVTMSTLAWTVQGTAGVLLTIAADTTVGPTASLATGAAAPCVFGNLTISNNLSTALSGLQFGGTANGFLVASLGNRTLDLTNLALNTPTDVAATKNVISVSASANANITVTNLIGIAGTQSGLLRAVNIQAVGSCNATVSGCSVVTDNMDAGIRCNVNTGVTLSLTSRDNAFVGSSTTTSGFLTGTSLGTITLNALSGYNYSTNTSSYSYSQLSAMTKVAASAAFTNITGNFTPAANSPLITTGTSSQSATDRTGAAQPNTQGYVTAGAVRVAQNSTSSGGSGVGRSYGLGRGII